MTYQRFVALGDSLTEGLDDLHPDNSIYRGWADLVAERLAADAPALRYANLGVRGRRLDQIVVEQFPAAADLEPDLVALFGGANDLMTTRGYRADVVAKRVRGAVRLLTDIAPEVVVFTLSDVSNRIPAVRWMGSRIQAFNDIMREAADRHGAHLVDLWPDESVHDLRYFGRDRLHLSEHGHRRVAGHTLDALGVPYERSWLEPLPGDPATRACSPTPAGCGVRCCRPRAPGWSTTSPDAPPATGSPPSARSSRPSSATCSPATATRAPAPEPAPGDHPPGPDAHGPHGNGDTHRIRHPT
ncbi:SGNH/GDSL hydrolase family protein [Saccharomonospora sp. CUA-673]|uniref:SGNH/GDSL hydrolase family protein n=1 Tax=Saccharomonospora sp. CUA-673 TaxID=1904969 RepID=UPI000ADB4FED